MLSYCLKCRKNTESKNPEVVKIKNGRIILLSKCAVCNSKKSNFLKEQESKGLLSNLMGMKIPVLSEKDKMNAIVNKLFLAGDRFILEMHLKQLGFTYSAGGSFIKNTERIKQIKETGDSSYIYQNELDEACFQHDMIYEDFKDLNRRTAADKVLRKKAFSFAKNPKYDGYHRGLISMVYKFPDRKTLGGTVKKESISNN